MSTFAVETRKLRKEYKTVTAVEGLDLAVKKGELFALLGVNGAGKTTTIKMLSCLSAPTSGEAIVGGHPLSESREIKKIISVCPQETAVAPGLTVKENLEFICGVYGINGEKRAETVAKTVRELHLEPVLSRKAGKLSGGWQRRVGLAMALITSPEILFLDEPTLGLDVLARSELWELIGTLKGSMTVLLTTHYMEEAEALSDRVGIMKDGRLVAVDTPAALCARTDAKNLEGAFLALVKGEKQ